MGTRRDPTNCVHHQEAGNTQRRSSIISIMITESKEKCRHVDKLLEVSGVSTTLVNLLMAQILPLLAYMVCDTISPVLPPAHLSSAFLNKKPPLTETCIGSLSLLHDHVTKIWNFVHYITDPVPN